MPNFTIRRRKPKKPVQHVQKPPEPQPVEEKIDETEMEYVESSDEEYITAAMQDLKLERQPSPPPRPQNRPTTQKRVHFDPRTEPQYKKPAIVAQQPVKAASYARHFGPTKLNNDPYTRRPTMPRPYLRPPKKKGVPRMRFRSHYGVGAEHLDTRTKSNMLLNHCFG